MLVFHWPELIPCSQPSYRGDWEMQGGSGNIDNGHCHCQVTLRGSSHFKSRINVVLKRYVICLLLVYQPEDENGGGGRELTIMTLILWILSITLIAPCIKSPPQTVFPGAPRGHSPDT